MHQLYSYIVGAKKGDKCSGKLWTRHYTAVYFYTAVNLYTQYIYIQGLILKYIYIRGVELKYISGTLFLYCSIEIYGYNVYINRT